MNDQFLKYEHSIPIIFSHIEGQYPCEYSLGNEEFQILFTPFDYHFIAGNPDVSLDAVTNAMREYIKQHQKEEFILFGPNQQWEHQLQQLFQSIGGVVDTRHVFELNHEQFLQIKQSYKFQYQPTLIFEQDELSTIPYPKAIIKDNEEIISFASAFMLGKQEAEIDVWTKESHRKKKMAFEVSLVLIQYLIDQNIKPNWNTWARKESSQKLAEKLGFELRNKIPAYIWVKDFGEF